MVSYSDFQKLDLRVAKVLEAERVVGSEKLIRLKIEVGEDNCKSPPEKTVKQIVAGIGKAYSPEELIGREIVVVNNLEPRSLMSLESQGMLLAANNGEPVLLIPDKEVPVGSQVK